MLRRRREAIIPAVGTAAAHGAPGGTTGSSAHSAERCRHLTPLETTSALWTGTSDGFGKRARARDTSSNRSFRVDTAKLQHRYQQLQRLVHPDFFSQRSQTEKDFSEKHSTLVNDAYKTLLAPLSRGLYLLKLHGIEIPERTDYEMDRQFLMEIMETNEKLAEAESEAAMKEIESIVKAKQKEFTDNLSSAFEQGDFEEAKEILTKMRYFSNIEEKIKLKKIPL
ncbi:iron-sulfur cluster co-chaperone protein HscB isoform X2 [Pan troglodytes]|uniref:iron-sulfur cluster co-chaperone protein HscB isoform X2 n=1 Tax=Pan troglodytes TaxID=9598 RepID=UPI0023EFCBFF|nr:iron-sulfur cluster co-chaperone protein HscB isoform X2 [Pan troglodytes]